jgi:hypothetical protein
MFDQVTKIEFNGKTYNQKHGNAFDRGSADSYYGRERNPHCGGVGGNSGPRIEMSLLSSEEINDYHAGYDYNEQHGDKKDYD